MGTNNCFTLTLKMSNTTVLYCCYMYTSGITPDMYRTTDIYQNSLLQGCQHRIWYIKSQRLEEQVRTRKNHLVEASFCPFSNQLLQIYVWNKLYRFPTITKFHLLFIHRPFARTTWMPHGANKTTGTGARHLVDFIILLIRDIFTRTYLLPNSSVLASTGYI